jgi:hypothetical protein
MREWREVGAVVLLQIQRGPLKQGATRKVYQPDGALVSVERFFLNQRGVTALFEGQEALDVHHADHPNSRNRDTNPLSIGFTSHYAHLQRRFGEHVKLGIAGENIIVQTDEVFDEGALAAEIAFRSADGGLTIIQNLYAIPPCKPFSAYCLNQPEEQVLPHTIADTLRYLSSGLRGFCGQPIDGTAHEIRVGDRMLVAVE